MGKAVIATASPGIVDYVEHQVTGLLVPPADVCALKQAILHLWNHVDQARALGHEGRHRVDSGMSLDHYVNHLAALIDRLTEPYRA